MILVRAETPEQELLCLTADIVSAHLARTATPMGELAELIRAVYLALSRAGAPAPEAVEARQQPAVPIKKSVFSSYIVCLEDGKKLSMLKRHLAASYGLTPDAYRAKWNLPADYPMVAPDYAARRSTLARKFGLGRKPEAVDAPTPVVEAAAPAVPEAAEVVVQRIPERKRGRKPGSKNREPDLVDLAGD